MTSPAAQVFWDVAADDAVPHRPGAGRQRAADHPGAGVQRGPRGRTRRGAHPTDVPAFAAKVAAVGVGDPAVVASQATSRGEYLRRPDLGRLPANLESVPAGDADIGVVLADGLSPRALVEHGVGLLSALVATLGRDHSIAAPVIATQAGWRWAITLVRGWVSAP